MKSSKFEYILLFDYTSPYVVLLHANFHIHSKKLGFLVIESNTVRF